MTDFDDEIREIMALSKKLYSIFRDDDAQRTHQNGYANARNIMNTTMAKAFCKNPEELKAIEAEEQALEDKRNPKIELSITPSELLLMLQGLIYYHQSKEAEKYIKHSIDAGITSEKRWSKVAEIMLIKNPDEKLSRHGDDELIWYNVLIGSGMKPRQASEEVFKKFKFSSQEACDKWLRRAIEKRKTGFLAELPKPGTSPRLK